MNIKTTLLLLEKMLAPKGLNEVQKLILEKSLEGYSYKVMANHYNYSEGYLKDSGSILWQALSQTMGQQINKHNVYRLIYSLQPQETFSHPLDWEEAMSMGQERDLKIS